MASINLLLLTWKPSSGQQGASSAVRVQPERLSEKTNFFVGCDSLNSEYNKVKSESGIRSGSTPASAGVTNLIVKLIGWAGNLTCSGSQFQGVLIA